MNPSDDNLATSADPFRERSDGGEIVVARVLGGAFHFHSHSRALLDLVEAAYGGLPEHRVAQPAPVFDVELRLVPVPSRAPYEVPPTVQSQSGAGLLCGVMDASNYVVMAPEQGRAMVVVSEDMLGHAYHVRYELIEFVVFTLATRRLGLVPLHGACVGQHGRGLLLLGASGAGKSTLALHSLLRGMDFLSEDAVFVAPESMQATGVANYLHVKSDALRFVDDASAASWIGHAPVIRRRSGVAKHEADLRQGSFALAQSALELVGAVFVSNQGTAGSNALLSTLPPASVEQRLAEDQPYAAGQPGWERFVQRMTSLGVHELRRGNHPSEGVEALRSLLG